MDQKRLGSTDNTQNNLSMADDGQNNMSLVEHLEEFRGRLIVAVITFLVATIACLYFVEFFVQLILNLSEGYTLIAITPTEVVVEYMKVALIMGVVISLPMIVYQVWGFIRPGMKKEERKVVFWALMAGLAFFIVGVVFAYTLMLPLTLVFLRGIDTTQTISPMISIASFISFVLSTLFTFGLVFEMPVLVVLLTQLGVLKPEWLIKSRKIAIVVIFIVAAIITPPDVMSQLMIGIPMLLLYELSVLACRVIVRGKKKKDAHAAA